jgi:hypothetical protein
MNTTIENDEILQKTQIEWERLNVETNERLYVLQRAHTLFSEIEVLRTRVETIINRVEMVLSETIVSSNSFQQAKNHLNKLKVNVPLILIRVLDCLIFCIQQIELDQYKSAEHDITICYKRRDEFIGLLQAWYEMDWSKYLDLSDFQAKITQTFEVNMNSI